MSDDLKLITGIKSAEWVERIVHKIHCVSEGDYAEADAGERIWQKHQEEAIRSALMNMPVAAMAYMCMALTAGISYQCECGRIIEVNGKTGELRKVRPQGDRLPGVTVRQPPP